MALETDAILRRSRGFPLMTRFSRAAVFFRISFAPTLGTVGQTRWVSPKGFSSFSSITKPIGEKENSGMRVINFPPHYSFPSIKNRSTSVQNRLIRRRAENVRDSKALITDSIIFFLALSCSQHKHKENRLATNTQISPKDLPGQTASHSICRKDRSSLSAFFSPKEAVNKPNGDTNRLNSQQLCNTVTGPPGAAAQVNGKTSTNCQNKCIQLANQKRLDQLDSEPINLPSGNSHGPVEQWEEALMLQGGGD